MNLYFKTVKFKKHLLDVTTSKSNCHSLISHSLIELDPRCAFPAPNLLFCDYSSFAWFPAVGAVPQLMFI